MENILEKYEINSNFGNIQIDEEFHYGFGVRWFWNAYLPGEIKSKKTVKRLIFINQIFIYLITLKWLSWKV